MTKVFYKRIYDKEQNSSSYRVLVDRLWPRGISKERANLNEWSKVIAGVLSYGSGLIMILKKFKDFVKNIN